MTRSFRPVTINVPTIPAAHYLVGRLTGWDEMAVGSRLLAGLVRSEQGELIDFSQMLATIYDRLLAEVFLTEFGEKASCQAECHACGEPFEFGLSLCELIAAQDAEAAEVGLPDEAGYWAVGDMRVRAPTLADAALGPAMLTQICAPECTDDVAVSTFLERAAPLLTVTLEATCPDCAVAQSLTFDLPRFLSQAISDERPFLIRETHLIAARYGWSHAEIMAQTRTDRRAYASLIESERSAALRQRSVG